MMFRYSELMYGGSYGRMDARPPLHMYVCRHGILSVAEANKTLILFRSGVAEMLPLIYKVYKYNT